MIGIVGGAGPLAGLDVFRKIIELTPAATDQDHAPVLLFSLPSELPDRTEFLLGREKTNPAYAFSKILLQLEAAGASVAGIACNTAHAPQILELIQQELQGQNSKLELLHLIEEVAHYLAEQFPGKNIGVLSTTGTRRTGLYKKALEVRGLTVLEVEEEWQDRLHKIVYDPQYGIKARSSPVSEKARQELDSVMHHLSEKGAEVLLLGCTELPLAFSQAVFDTLPVVNSNQLLARALIERFKKTIL